jgi:RNA methyltransferase, TrmH family
LDGLIVTPITSPQNPQIKLIRSLADKKGRREHGLFVAEGMQMLEKAMAQGWMPQHFVATRPVHLWDDVKPLVVSSKLMSDLSAQNNPHDVLATFKPRFLTHPPKSGTVIALEAIRDPGNLGNILRTAEAAGVSGIILAGDCCDPYAPECIRASTGSIFASQISRMPVANLADFIRGWSGDSVATAMTAKDTHRRLYTAPTLIVLGSESSGLSDDVTSACKVKVRIPMAKGVESLNIATAAAVMLYEAIK